jgi:RNA polymerase sigma-70 factor (ECF subfamily)
MSESATLAAIEAIARNSYGRLIAYISARSGDVAGAEDALGDAIAAALDDGRRTASRRNRKRGCCTQRATA